MTELDFSREGVPHRRGQRVWFKPSEEDNFIRMTLLPQLWELSSDDRKRFKDKLDPELGIRSLRNLTYDELREISEKLDTTS